jgi:propanol-preferring alcohol dehydrogenase
MHAAVLRRPAPIGERPLALDELADPQPGPDDVVIDVTACGVCRTDLQLVEGDLAARRLPVVPGHQIVGRVRAAGARVRGSGGPAIGDRVGVAWIATACGACRFCLGGRENLCEQATFTGWDRDGGYAERTVADHRFVYALPDGFDDIGAAPLLCGGVIGYRCLRLVEASPGMRLGLYGFGASATIVIQVARHLGCDVYVVTRSRDEQQRALALGATWVGSPGRAPPVPLDAAITFAPVGAVVIDALSALDRGGTVAVNAIHLDGIPAFDYRRLWWERSIRSVANVTRADVTALLELAPLLPIVTHADRYPLDQANEALQALAQGHVSGAAVLEVHSSP